MYRLSAYFMSRSIGDLPLDCFLATVFLIVVYFMTHLKMTAASFLLTVFGTYLSIMAAQVRHHIFAYLLVIKWPLS